MVWEAGGVIVMMWWPQGRAGHLTHHPGSEDGQRWILIKSNGIIMKEVKLCPGCYKWVVNAQVVISQQIKKQEPRQHKIKHVQDHHHHFLGSLHLHADPVCSSCWAGSPKKTKLFLFARTCSCLWIQQKNLQQQLHGRVWFCEGDLRW